VRTQVCELMLPLTWIMSSKACALADATDNCASQWAQTGGFSHQHHAALDRPGFQGFRGYGVPVDLRRRHTARSAVRSMLRIRNA
jgi:hypothetical protein